MKKPASHVVAWRNAIAESRSLPRREKTVAMFLSKHMSAAGGSCFPGVELLAKESGYGVRSVQDGLHALVKHGWIAVAERYDEKGAQLSNSYSATFPELSTGGANIAPGGCNGFTEGVQNGGAETAPEVDIGRGRSLEDASGVAVAADEPVYLSLEESKARLRELRKVQEVAPPPRVLDRCYPTDAHPALRGWEGWTDVAGNLHAPSCTPGTCELLGLKEAEG